MIASVVSESKQYDVEVEGGEIRGQWRGGVIIRRMRSQSKPIARVEEEKIGETKSRAVQDFLIAADIW